MSTRTRKAAEPVAVQAADAATVDATVTANKPTATDRLNDVLTTIGKTVAKPGAEVDVKWGKAVGLAGGGSVYINRGNADVRSSQKQVAEWVAQGLGTARGPQSQYLRITF